jgi:hypothetical protein
MKMYRAPFQDEDHLQADVMRFMAIVAFCLIAILAMVRQTPSDSHPAAPLPQPPIAETAPPAIKQTSPQGAPSAPKPVMDREVSPQVEKVEQETPVTQTAQANPIETNTAAVEPESQKQKVTDTNTDQDAAAKHGITLRFVSTRDFLRLLNNSSVTLYAYNDQQFLSWNRNQRFDPATPPDRVYELDPATVPDLMHQALPDSFTPADATWAVGLPTHVEQQIQHHLSQVDSGELHINRYQEVRHVPPG